MPEIPHGSYDYLSPAQIGGLSKLEKRFVDSTESAPFDENRQVEMISGGDRGPLMMWLEEKRRGFVYSQGWKSPDEWKSDFDRYDSEDRWTYSFVDTLQKEEDGEPILISSIRITRVDDIGDCMSVVDMAGVSDPEDLPGEWATILAESSNAGQLYDITRMLPPTDKDVTFDEYIDSFTRITGRGIYHTASKVDDDPLWVFATSGGLSALLNRLGLQNELIGRFKPPEYRKSVSLCAMRPKDMLSFLLEEEGQVVRRKTLDNLRQGIIEASGLTYTSSV